MKTTRDAILEAALAIANSSGLSNVTLRAVATELGLSPGNVSYHFRRKEDLILGLVELHSANNRQRMSARPETLEAFLELWGTLFRHQHRFRGLVVALPDLVESYESMCSHYSAVETQRRQGIYALLATLRSNGEIEATDDEIWRVVSHITLIARFWIAEARVSYKKQSVDRIVGHYQALIADTLSSFVTEKAAMAHRDYASRWLRV